MFISSIDEDAADDELAAYYDSQRAAWGFLPDYARAFSTRPDIAGAWGTLSAAVRDGMDRRLFEIATIAAARARRSTYCTAAHSKFLRDVCDDEATMRAICDDPDGSTLEPRDRAAYELAAAVAGDASSVTQPQVDRALASGLSERDVADVVFAAAARCFFTAVLDGLGAQLDPQTAATFSPDVLRSMVVGRPVG
ncbi:MAG: carboxymuconolactone decarboxylase family protein [Angustibacter sp.]